MTLERETGVINGSYSDDLLFLRQLILDGQWDDVLEFIAPLSSVGGAFDSARFRFAVLRAKFVEQVCVRGESTDEGNSSNSSSSAVDAVVETLRQLEPVCPSRQRYSDLCLMLTADARRISEHPEFRAWNPHKGRVACFEEVLPLVQDLLGGDKRQQRAAAVDAKALVASNDRYSLLPSHRY